MTGNTVVCNVGNSWKSNAVRIGEPLPGRDGMRALCDGTTALFVFKDMLDHSRLAACQEAIESQRRQATVSGYVNGSLTTIGPYLNRYLSNTSEYFERAGESGNLFPNPHTDLRSQVRQLLVNAFDMERLEVAVQGVGQQYSPAVVRLHADGMSNPLHNDKIVRDAAGSELVLARLKHQLSCIVCINECTSGGELRHYRHRWHPDDEKFKIPNGLGYYDDVVAGAECLTFRPSTGDVYVMNPTYYHSINEVAGAERRTLGFFFGFFDDCLTEAVCWS